MSSHYHRCKFCGIMLTVESGDDCPPQWSSVLLKMLSCNRCSDFRARSSMMGREIRKVCLGLVQLINNGKSSQDIEHRARKSLEAMTWKVAEHVCKFYRISTIWNHDFVDQIMEHPDRSSVILSTYASMVRREAETQHRKHEPANDHEEVPDRSVGAPEDQASLSVQADAQGPVAVAETETNKPAGGAGEDQPKRVVDDTLYI